MSSSKTRYTQTSLEKDAHDMHGAFIWFIIILGVGFSDFIYFQMVSTMFSKDDPLMQGIAFAGAITTALSVLLLYYGKKKVFRPGKQVWIAWVFTFIEIGVMISNDILFFAQKSGNNTDSFLAFWKVFCPAAPVISVVGWLLISFFDPSRALLHLKMSKADELEAAEAKMHAEIEQSEIDFKLAMHRMRMEAKYEAADDMKAHLRKTIQYAVQEDLRIGASEMGREIAGSLTNTPISQLSQPKSSRVVDADPPRQQLAPAKAAHKVQYVDPHQVKPEVDAEKKPLEEKKGVRAWIDEKVFKVSEEDSRDGLVRIKPGTFAEPVDPKDEIPDENAVWSKKDGKWMEAEKAREKQEDQGEKIKQPKLPYNPAKWTKKHWMLAKETLPEDEYNDLFDMYLGDSPSEEYVREENENPQ